jgi:hypothetical protein
MLSRNYFRLFTTVHEASSKMDIGRQSLASQATALALKELSDANPGRLDLTMSYDFRRAATSPKFSYCTRRNLRLAKSPWERGYAVTTPRRAISDLAGAGEVERDIIAEGLCEGQKRVTRQEITKARNRPQNPEWLQRLLEEAR